MELSLCVLLLLYSLFLCTCRALVFLAFYTITMWVAVGGNLAYLIVRNKYLPSHAIGPIVGEIPL